MARAGRIHWQHTGATKQKLYSEITNPGNAIVGNEQCVKTTVFGKDSWGKFTIAWSGLAPATT